MDEEVSWRVELAIRPGELENFRKLTGEMVAFARGESGALSYQRFVSDSGTTVEIYERYADSAAAVSHLRAFEKNFAPGFAKMVDRKRFTVFGAPSDALKSILDGFGAVYLRPLGDFDYWA